MQWTERMAKWSTPGDFAAIVRSKLRTAALFSPIPLGEYPWPGANVRPFLLQHRIVVVTFFWLPDDRREHTHPSSKGAP